MNHHKFTRNLVALAAFAAVPSAFQSHVYAQQTNNASNLTNQAAPSASAVTTGGTNINYQTNNTYQNEVGFGPGVLSNANALHRRKCRQQQVGRLRCRYRGGNCRKKHGKCRDRLSIWFICHRSLQNTCQNDLT